MSRETDSDSDDDWLSSFGYSINFQQPKKKTLDELFKENKILHESQEKERKLRSIEVQDVPYEDKIPTPDADAIPDVFQPDLVQKLLAIKSVNDTLEEVSVRLLGECNHLQFITKKDLTLLKFGFHCNLDLSFEFERQLIALNENELQEWIKCCETSSLKKIRQLNPLVQYFLKTMSIYSDVKYVKACQKFIKATCKLHCVKDISISSSDVFMILFNYGVNTKKEIFNILPGSKEMQRSHIVEEISSKWVFNLKALLTSIGDLIKQCKINQVCLYNIFTYLLWMSMDDFLHINAQLQECTTIILYRFSKSDWKIWRLKIVQFMMSLEEVKELKISYWSLIIKMLEGISNKAARGMELHNYISFLALKKLTNSFSDSNIPKYSKKLFNIKVLQPILEKVYVIEESLQNVAIKFIKLYVHSLKINSQGEQTKLQVLLKRCEDSLSKYASENQTEICMVRSRIGTMVFESVEKTHWNVLQTS